MGELFSLLTALFFAASVICFKKIVASSSAFGLTLFKNTVALVLLAGTSLAFGHFSISTVSPRDLAIICLSGALGVGVSDVLFFMTLKRLGASRTAIIDCLYPPFVIVFSLFMINEQLTMRVLLGGVLVLGSVLICSARHYGEPIPRSQFLSGCGLGLLSMLVISFAIVLVKPLLGTYPLSWVSTLRMAGGTVVLALGLPFHPNRQAVFDAFRPQSAWKWMLLGTLFGSYLSTMTWLAGFRYTEAGASAVLNQTSTVLIVIFAWIFLGESMTRLKLLAVGTAFAGAVLVVT
jgi:drug/metabolite transporter (DMT)-like permease